jgi:hypothetical protein
MVDYQVLVEDSVFTFDSNITFHKDAVFRTQRLKMTLFIPYNYPFTMTEDVSRFITQFVDTEALDGQTWNMTPDGLRCISCPEPQPEEKPEHTGEEVSNLEIDGSFDLEIVQGSVYALEMIGAENEKAKYTVEQHGNTIVIDYDNDREFNADDLLNELKIRVTMPALESLSARGKGDINFKGFRSDNMQIDLSGKISAKGEMEAQEVTVEISGACDLALKGNGNTLSADISGLSSLEAYKFATKNASIEVSGASSAKVSVSENLEIQKDFVSSVDYRGKPNVTVNQ